MVKAFELDRATWRAAYVKVAAPDFRGRLLSILHRQNPKLFRKARWDVQRRVAAVVSQYCSTLPRQGLENVKTWEDLYLKLHPRRTKWRFSDMIDP